MFFIFFTQQEFGSGAKIKEIEGVSTQKIKEFIIGMRVFGADDAGGGNGKYCHLIRKTRKARAWTKLISP